MPVRFVAAPVSPSHKPLLLLSAELPGRLVLHEVDTCEATFSNSTMLQILIQVRRQGRAAVSHVVMPVVSHAGEAAGPGQRESYIHACGESCLW